jgi:hypothetical protein
VFEFPRASSVEVRAVRADGEFAHASIPLAPTDPEPSLRAKGDLTVGGAVTLDGSATQDPDGLIQKFVWDTDGDGTYETDTGLTRSVATSYSSAGTKVAGLEVDYSYGWSQSVISFPIRSATTSPTGTTPTTGTGTGTPLPGPSISVATLRLGKLLKSGLPLKLNCGNVCVISFRLVVDGRTAKRLHLTKRARAVAIGRTQGQFAAGPARPILKLGTAARRILRRARSLRATLKGSIAQTGVKTLTVSKGIIFKR